MGVFRGGYRQYDGDFLPLSTRFGVIVGAEFSRMFKAKWNRRVMLGSLLFLAAIEAVQIGKAMLEEQVGQALPIELGLLEKLLAAELFFMAILVAVAGSGIIADDRRSNALLLYLSKPISPARYMLGKGLALAALLSIVYVVPGLVHIVVSVLFLPNVGMAAFARDLLSVVVIGVVHVGATCIFMLTLSSLSTRKWYIGLGWAGAYFFSKGVSQAARNSSDGAAWADFLSLPDLYEKSAHWVMSPQWADAAPLVALLILTGLAFGLLVYRMKRLMKDAVGS